MFKIGKLEDINNEKVDISLFNQEKTYFKEGKKDRTEAFKSLSFKVSAEDYSIGFDLNCKLEDLYKIPMHETIDFKKYILSGETFFRIKKDDSIEPEMNIKVTRYTESNFIVYLTFSTDRRNYYYSGIIEFEFDLNDYINKEPEDDSVNVFGITYEK